MALAFKFIPAYLLLALSLVGAIFCWLSSDVLERKRPKRRYGSRGSNPTTKELRNFRLWLIVIAVVIALPWTIGLKWTMDLQTENEFNSSEGVLYPAAESVSLPAGCLKHSDDLAIVSGTNASPTDTFPHTVIRIGCDDLLVVDKDKAGRIAITTTVRDRDYKIVVDVDHGKYVINENNVFRKERPRIDKSTLKVVDEYGQEVLYLHMANRNTLVLRALIYNKNLTMPLRIDGLHPFGMSGSTFSQSCVGYSKRADAQIGECKIR